MREALAKREGERGTYRGTFERFGIKTGWKGRVEKTVLLKEIEDLSGKPVCDHLWFNFTKAFAALGLQPGDHVEFDGRVSAYVKGYQGWRDDVDSYTEVDYKLSRPTRVRKVEKDGGDGRGERANEQSGL